MVQSQVTTHQVAFICDGSCISFFLFFMVDDGLVMVMSLGLPCFLEAHGVQSQLGGANCASKV